jgi:hypothetical protein
MIPLTDANDRGPERDENRRPRSTGFGFGSGHMPRRAATERNTREQSRERAGLGRLWTHREPRYLPDSDYPDRSGENEKQIVAVFGDTARLPVERHGSGIGLIRENERPRLPFPREGERRAQ